MITWKHEKIKDITLDKIAPMVVVGNNVTDKQAAEILIKTDCEFPHFSTSYKNIDTVKTLHAITNTPQKTTKKEDQIIRKRFGLISLTCISNHRIAPSCIRGPYGWCNWDGTIGCDNIKLRKCNPSQIAEDWHRVATAFPYLNLTCTVWSKWSNNMLALILYTIKDGNVIVDYPKNNKDNVPQLFNVAKYILNSKQVPSKTQDIGIHPIELEKRLIHLWGKDYPKYNTTQKE